MPLSPKPHRPPAHRPLLFATVWLGGGPLTGWLGWLAATTGAAWAGVGAGLVGATLLAMTAVGALSQRAGLLARPINAIANPEQDRLLLTFDDGPDPETTPEVLRLLAAGGHRATFFVIGHRAARHPVLLRQIHQGGHDIGLHSMRHRWHYCFWRPARIVADLQQVRRAIRAAGVEPIAAFRPPVGVLSPRITAAARGADLALIGWSARAFDAAPGARADRCLARTRRRLDPGEIVALHDTRGAAGPRMLPQLLAELERRGLVSVPLGDLLE